MEIEHIVGSVCGQRLCLEQATIAADTIDYLTARFSFSEDWNGAEKFAFFAKSGEEDEPAEVPLTDDRIAESQHLNLTAGRWKIWLVGIRTEGAEITQRITTTVAEIRVQLSGVTDGEPFPGETGSAGEQIVAQAISARNAAQAAAQNAGASANSAAEAAVSAAMSEDNAQESAESAEQSAEEIKNLTVSSETLPAGSSATVEKTGGDGEPFNLHFAIPRGDVGPQGPKGDPGEGVDVPVTTNLLKGDGNGNIVEAIPNRDYIDYDRDKQLSMVKSGFRFTARTDYVTIAGSRNEVHGGTVDIKGYQEIVMDAPSATLNGEDIATVDKIPTELSALAEDSEHRTVTDDEKASWNSKYTKPITGIPKNDLASKLQSSLDKADSAVQPAALNGYVPIEGEGYEQHQSGDVYLYREDEQGENISSSWVDQDSAGVSFGEHCLYVNEEGVFADDKPVAHKPEKVIRSGDMGVITLADNTEYYLTPNTDTGDFNVEFAFPSGNFHCWVRLTYGSTGDIVVPSAAKYIGDAPQFENGQTWELDIKDGVVVAGKVGN